MLCSHEADGDEACATKLLWTRVHGGITKALAGTTLADLVEFADDTRDRRAGRRLSRQARPPTNHDNGDQWPIWRSRNLHVSAEGKQILKGLDLDGLEGARSTR